MRALSRSLSQAGQRGWIVGGAARDLRLGRAVAEVDVAVDTDPGPLAEELERAGMGRCVLLSEASPRVFRVAGRREIDLARVEGGSIDRDLGRRDFTVNAIALEIPGGRWLDPFGGIRDLEAGRLRAVAAANFAEDPVRVLRAARFIATHGLLPDHGTSRAGRQSAPRLAQVAPERLRVEWIKILEAERAAPALAWAARIGALAPALGVPTAAVRRLASTRSRLDRPSVRRADLGARRAIRLALLAAGLDLNPAAAAAWLGSRRFSRDEASQTARLLDLVQSARAARSDRELWAWIRDAASRTPEALTLLNLLLPGRNGRNRRRALERRWKSARRGLQVSGSDVLAWTGIGPGPRVGAVLRDLEVEILRGAVRTRSQAREWVSADVLRR